MRIMRLTRGPAESRRGCQFSRGPVEHFELDDVPVSKLITEPKLNREC
jgi:hypothetical protein